MQPLLSMESVHLQTSSCNPPIFSCQFREFSRFRGGRSTHGNLPVPLHPRKTNMTVENPPGMKMYFLLNIGIFQCHVSFQGCSCREASVPTNPHHLWDWIPRPVPLRTVSAAPMPTNLAGFQESQPFNGRRDFRKGVEASYTHTPGGIRIEEIMCLIKLIHVYTNRCTYVCVYRNIYVCVCLCV